MNEIKEYYRIPEVKKAITEFAGYKTFSKFIKNDSDGLYIQKDRIQINDNKYKSKRRLLSGVNPKDYDRIIKRLDRTIYLSLNYLSRENEVFHKIQGYDWKIPGFEDTKAYMLGIDIDLQDGQDVDDRETREILEAALNYAAQEVDKLTNGHYISFFSGNGAYILIHPGFVSIMGSNKKRMEGYDIITRAFNNFIVDAKLKFWRANPDTMDVIKFDSIMMVNRVFKAPLSIHAKKDYIVNPIIDGEIQRVKYNDVSVDYLQEVNQLLHDFKSKEPLNDSVQIFKEVLDPYVVEAIQNIKNKEHNLQNSQKAYKTEPPTEAVPKEIIIQEPVCRALWDTHSNWGNEGRRRRLGIMVSILNSLGWDVDSIASELQSFINTMGWHDLNVYESINHYLELFPPNYKTLYEKGGNLFTPRIGDFTDYLPDIDDLDIENTKNPFKAIVYLADEENIPWAVKQRIKWRLFLLDTDSNQTRTLRKIGEYLDNELNYFLDVEEDNNTKLPNQVYIYCEPEKVYKGYTLGAFKNYLNKEFDGYLFHDNEAKRVYGTFHRWDGISEDVIGFKNCMFNMTKFKTIGADPDNRVTFQVPYNYNPKAKSEWLETKLKEILIDSYGTPEEGTDEKYIFFLQMLGYIFKYGNPWHKMFFIVGDGRNGKSTLMALINALFPGKVSGVPLENFEASKGNQFSLWPVIGKLVNIVYELPEKTIKHTGIIKQVTGEDHVNIDRKHLTPWYGKLSCKMIGIGNELPMFYDSTIALWDRVYCIELKNEFTENRDPNLTEKIINNQEAMEWLITTSINEYKKVEKNGWILSDDLEERKTEWQLKAYPALGVAKVIFEVTDDPENYLSRAEVVKAINRECDDRNLRKPYTRQQYYKVMELINAERDDGFWNSDERKTERGFRNVKYSEYYKDKLKKDKKENPKKIILTDDGKDQLATIQTNKGLNLIQRAIWQTLTNLGDKTQEQIIMEVKDLTKEDKRDIDRTINDMLSNNILKFD